MELSENAKTLLEERYLIKDEKGKVIEAPEDLFRRVAKNIAQADKKYGKKSTANKTEEEFYEIMVNLKFLPNSPTLFNAGREYQQLSACFVLPIPDTMEGIFQAIYDMAMIQKSGGGTGFSFSDLRPSGDKVTSSMGKSSGPISFLHAFDAATDTIKQGGMRRGANMGVMHVSHPDIEQFIDAKSVEGKITNFNLSVGISNDFMNKVKNQEKFALLNPRDGTIVRYVEAKMLLDKIALNAWKSGEPGVVFLDLINEGNPLPELGEIKATNPCIEENMLIRIRERGNLHPTWVPIRLIQIGDMVLGHDGKYHKVSAVIDQGIKPVINVHLRNGRYITCTPDHPFIVNNTKIPAEYATCVECTTRNEDMTNFTFSEQSPTYKKGWLDGCIYGDGWSGERIGFCSPDESFIQQVTMLLNDTFGSNSIFRSYEQQSGNSIFRVHTGVKEAVEYYKKFDISAVKNQSMEYQTGFLAGWYKCDGHVENNNGCESLCLTITENNMEAVDAIWYILQTFGIIPKIYYNKRTGHPSDSKYKIKSSNSYKILVSGTQYDDLAGLIGWEKKDSGSYRTKPHVEIVKIEAVEKGARVYDLTVEDSHSFIVEGVKVSNCGEQPLLPYESCNLGSINLAKFVDKEGKIDYNELSRVVGVAIHFLDNVIDVNKYPLESIKTNTIANRKVGLGIMGFADMLVLMNIPYDSHQAIHIAIQVMDFINTEALEASCLLAQERGSFANVGKSIYADWEEPPRNATRTTIAPTGSLSMIANCSSGIEPYFALAYKRFVLDKELVELNPLLATVLKKYGIKLDVDELISHRGNIQKMDVPEDVKKLFKTAHDIKPDCHIRIQAAFQANVDNAVSKTINLPHHATVEDVISSYILAWEQECKGITIYRDGSRAVQVLSTGTPKDRPRKLDGSTVKLQTGCGSLYVTINSSDGHVFEVFANIGKSGGCAIANTEALCRTISTAMRAGVSIDIIIKQLRGIRCPSPSMDKAVILSCPDAIGQALQEFSEVKVKEKVGGACPFCNGQLVFEEGCVHCLGCNFTRCG